MELEEVLESELVELELRARTKNRVLKELVELLAKRDKINSVDQFYQPILEREEEGSTGLGAGVALPHAKSKAVEELAVAVGRAEAGIDFDSFDGQPVKLFFMVADSPGYSEPYLEIVSSLSDRLRKKELRARLLAAETEEEIIDELS